MTPRTRLVLGLADHPCQLCGKGAPQIVESRNVRRRRDRRNPRWDARVRVSEVCPHGRSQLRLEGMTSATSG